MQNTTAQPITNANRDEVVNCLSKLGMVAKAADAVAEAAIANDMKPQELIDTVLALANRAYTKLKN